MRFLGQFIAMVVALGLLAIPRLLQTSKLKVQIIRSFLLLSSTAFNFLALRHLRLDQTTTIGFLTPLMVAILAGPFLGEWIGWRRAIAIGIGFAGILVALRPGVTAVHYAFGFSLAGMLSYAVFSLVTRYLASYDPAEVTLFYSLLAGSIVMAPFAIAEWQWPRDTLVWFYCCRWDFMAVSAITCLLFLTVTRRPPPSHPSSTSASSRTRRPATSCSARFRIDGPSPAPPL